MFVNPRAEKCGYFIYTQRNALNYRSLAEFRVTASFFDSISATGRETSYFFRCAEDTPLKTRVKWETNVCISMGLRVNSCTASCTPVGTQKHHVLEIPCDIMEP